MSKQLQIRNLTAEFLIFQAENKAVNGDRHDMQRNRTK